MTRVTTRECSRLERSPGRESLPAVPVVPINPPVAKGFAAADRAGR
jgi:hypothetical protein